MPDLEGKVGFTQGWRKKDPGAAIDFKFSQLISDVTAVKNQC